MPDGGMEIRAAQPEDVMTIVSLSDALFREDAGSRDRSMNLGWALQEGRDYFADLIVDDAAACWLAASSNEDGALGYLASRLSEGNSLRPVRLSILESMYVREEYRGFEVGEKLFGRFLAWSREREARQISVTAYAANEGAIRFYEKMGLHVKTLSLECEVGN